MVILFAALVDENGTLVPDADHTLHVSVSGAGKLLGLESGDQYSTQSYASDARKTHQGRLIAIIGYNEEGKGSIHVQVKDRDTGRVKKVSIGIKR